MSEQMTTEDWKEKRKANQAHRASRSDHNRELLVKAGIPFRETSGAALIRTPGMPAVDYYLGTDKWKDCLTNRYHTGGVRTFMRWYLAHRKPEISDV